jgi:hypothetical protein
VNEEPETTFADYQRLFLLVFNRECTTTDFAGATPYVSLDDLEALARVPEEWTRARQRYEDWRRLNVQALFRA